MKHKYLLATAVIPMFVASCDNPADQTTSATVKEAVATSPAAPATGGTRYEFAESSTIGFIGSKVTGSHTGGFKSFSGGFTLAEGKLSGTGQKITIDMDSVWSDDEKLTGHLKTADFFNVEKHPEATFELTGLTETSGGNYEVAGNLTLTGTTKNIAFPATLTRNGDSARIDAKFDINRKDFGIVYAGMADNLIKDEVVIELKLDVVPAKQSL